MSFWQQLSLEVRGRSDMMSSLRGEGGISQKMTIDDKGVEEVHQMMTDDGDRIKNKVKDDKNHQ